MSYYDEDDCDGIPESCEKCKCNNGFCRETGTPYCDYDYGYENCPYFEKGEINVTENKETSGMLSVQIDTSDMYERINATFNNTIKKTVASEISRIVKAEFESQIRTYSQEILHKKVQDCVDALFAQPVTIGGGWREEAKTITREQYLFDEIGKQLESGLAKTKFDERITNETRKHIENFADKTRREVNSSVKTIFDQAMQQNLTNSILAVLMQNETYQKLNTSVQNMIEAKK